jgi:hypothetical protein
MNNDNYNINNTLIINSEFGSSSNIEDVGIKTQPGDGTSLNNGQNIKNQALLNENGILNYSFLNITAPPNYNLVGYLIEADIDYSFYNVIEGVNNTFIISIGPLDNNNNPILPPYLGIVPIRPGNYSPNLLCQELNDSFNSFYENVVGVQTGPYLFRYDEQYRRITMRQNPTVLGLDTYIYSFYPVNNSGVSDIALLDELSLSWKLIGLVKNTGQVVPNFYTSTPDKDIPISYWIIPNDGYLVSPKVIDLRFTNSLLISSSYDCNSRNTNKNILENTNIITSIPIPPIYGADEIPQNTLKYTPNDYEYRNTFLINQNNINTIRIFITDIRGNLLNLNGGQYTLRLKIEPVKIIPPQDTIPEEITLNYFIKQLKERYLSERERVLGEKKKRKGISQEKIKKIKEILNND